MAVVQIIYLVINLIGIGMFLATLPSSGDVLFISTFFNFVGKHLGKFALALICVLFIGLFLPTLTFMTVLLTFMMIFNEHAN